MNNILCSTGALIGRPNGRNYKLLKEFSKRLTCDGFEFMMYSVWYDNFEEIICYLQEMEAYIPVVHCEKHIGEVISINDDIELKDALHRFEINCKIASQIKASSIVVHLWDGITSDQNFENNLKAYEWLYDISSKYGIDLLVENVVCNYKNPMERWCKLIERYPEIKFIFDTKMAAFHHQMELLYSNQYEWLWKGEHIKHLHINDYDGDYMEWSKLRTLPIGQGHIDFDRFFNFIKEKNYSGKYTVEATAFDKTGKVDFDMLNGCFEYIRKNM